MSAERATRGRPSRIDQLGATQPDIKARIDALLRSGVTQTEILRRLAGPLTEAGEPPLSRAGLNRYATRMEAVGKDLRELNAIADAWTSRLGEAPTGNVGAMTIEVLRSLAFRATLRARDESDEALDTEQIGELALALQRLERSAQLNLARERELRAAVAQAAAQAVDSVARSAGLTEDTAQIIRAAIEGAAT